MATSDFSSAPDPCVSDLASQAIADASLTQLDRIEHMLIGIHWSLIGHWWPQPSQYSPDDLNGGAVPSLAELDQSPFESKSVPRTPSPSRRRRLRKRLSNQRLWAMSQKSFEEESEKLDGHIKRPRLSDVSNPRNYHESQITCSKASHTDTSGNVQIVDCSRCKAKIQDCFCWQIFCCNCARIAKDCKCDQPAVQRRSCSKCGHIEDEPTLFSATPLLVYSSMFECSECGSKDAPTLIDSWHFLSESAHRCHMCGRIDAQEDIENCHGISCEVVAHRSCMSSNPPPHDCPHGGEALFFLCGSCITASNTVQCNLCLAATFALEAGSENKAVDGNGLSDIDGKGAAMETDGIVRAEKLAELETKMNNVFNVIDKADAKEINLPKSSSDLSVKVLKETHVWLQGQPPTDEVAQRLRGLDNLLVISSRSAL